MKRFYQLANYLWTFHTYFKLLHKFFKVLKSCNYNNNNKKNTSTHCLWGQNWFLAVEHWIFISIYIYAAHDSVMLFATSLRTNKKKKEIAHFQRNKSRRKIQFCIFIFLLEIIPCFSKSPGMPNKF